MFYDCQGVMSGVPIIFVVSCLKDGVDAGAGVMFSNAITIGFSLCFVDSYTPARPDTQFAW